MTDQPHDVPEDWDALPRRGSKRSLPDEPPLDDGLEPPILTLMASSWADLVGMLAVCTGGLVAIMALGQRPALAAFGWAAFLALIWWICAAAALIVIRQATPGMLLAGIRFVDPVSPDRVPRVLVAALVGVATLGLPGLLGSQLSPLRIAAASDLAIDTAV